MKVNFNIIRAGRAVLHVTDIEKSRLFYEKLGFVVTDTDNENLFLRGLEEHNHHSLWLKKKQEPAVEVISYKVTSEKDIDELESFFRRQGREVKRIKAGEQPAVGQTIRVQDITGIPIEFYAEMETVERLLQRYDLHTGAKVQRIDHFNCMVRDVETAYHYYLHKLDFACSEYTVGEQQKIWAAWLHRKPSVHDVAFMNGVGPRLHHIGFWLKDPMSLIDGCDVLAAAGYSTHIERGPGRHGLSNAFFLYVRDPDGHRIELYNGDYLTSDPDFKPIKWELDDPMRQTFWGHEAPDSWFDEASDVLDIQTGQKIALQQPKLKKSKPQFIM